MTNLIYQRNPSDCALACIAMHIGVDYHVLWGATNFPQRVIDEKGCSREMKKEALAHAKVPETDYTEVYVHEAQDYSLVRKLLWQRPAMLTVISLNRENTWHSVYWNGQELFDPSPGLVYQWLSQVYPLHVTLFKARAIS